MESAQVKKEVQLLNKRPVNKFTVFYSQFLTKIYQCSKSFGATIHPGTSHIFNKCSRN